MTLFEALVALVILGLAAVGFMGAFHVTSRSIQDAETWVQAVGYAEAAMEETKLGTSALPMASEPEGFTRAVAISPWIASPDLQLVTVEVTLPGGGTFTLERLARVP